MIKFDNRPFGSIEEMDAELIRRWNSVVSRGDTVHIIGDFCWKTEDYWFELLNQLKGNKVLIKGNHDLRRMSEKLQKKFQDIREIKSIKENNYRVTMCHYPLMFYPHDHSVRSIMLCGHVHQTIENDYLNLWRAKLIEDAKAGDANQGRIINVGCMQPYMDYTPRTIQELLTWWESEFAKGENDDR